MVIDERDEPEAIGHGFECRDSAMLVGAECAPGLGIGQELVEELVGCPEMEQRDRPGHPPRHEQSVRFSDGR